MSALHIRNETSTPQTPRPPEDPGNDAVGAWVFATVLGIVAATLAGWSIAGVVALAAGAVAVLAACKAVAAVDNGVLQRHDASLKRLDRTIVEVERKLEHIEQTK